MKVVGKVFITGGEERGGLFEWLLSANSTLNFSTHFFSMSNIFYSFFVEKLALLIGSIEGSRLASKFPLFLFSFFFSK